MRAAFPDGGLEVDRFECRGCDHVTAHEDGTLRVWRGFKPIHRTDGPTPEVEMPYYPIEAVGMTEGEVERAVSVAMRMLDIPMNRHERRARAALN